MILKAIEAQNFSRKVNKQFTLGPLNFSLGDNQVLSLFGPSGSGKSTLLRMLAGLEKPTAGSLKLFGIETNSSPAAKFFQQASTHGNVGMVFQDFALFPHLTVAENVGFGLKVQKKIEKFKTVEKLVLDYLDMVKLAHKAKVYPHELSGGERQRVALARALAPRPKLLLMDEPFSGLDVSLKQKVREETLALLRERGTACVFVTHDPAEALGMGDLILLLKDGSILQAGTPQELYTNPSSGFVVSLLGACNHWTIDSMQAESLWHSASGGNFGNESCLPLPAHPFAGKSLYVRREGVVLGQEECLQTPWRAELARVMYQGDSTLCFLNTQLWGEVVAQWREAVPSGPIFFGFDPLKMHFFDN